MPFERPKSDDVTFPPKSLKYKTHADQINEILAKYKKDLKSAITVEAKYGILFDFMTSIDECVNAED
jgi:hypothetical protein